MVRRLILGVLLGFCLLQTAVCAAQIKIPKTVDPSHLTILEGSYSNGLAIGPIDTKPGIYQYEAGMSGPTKLLIFAPGFKTITFGRPSQLPDIFAPKFERVPMVPVSIRLSYTDGRPIANARVSVSLFLNSHEYYGYDNGLAYQTEVASGTTNAAGWFRTKLPSLLDDPYFAKYNGYAPKGPAFEVRLPDLSSDRRWDFSPNRLDARRSYRQAVSMQLVYCATVRGTMKRSFLRRNNADAPLGVSEMKSSGKRYRVFFHATHGRSGQGSGVEDDGFFSLPLAPGVYDLSVEVDDADKGFTQKVIPLSGPGGVVLKEGEERVFTLE